MTQMQSPPARSSTRSRRGPLAALAADLWDKSGMLLVLLVLLTGFSIFVPYFFSWRNASGLALSMSTVGIISCGMLFCLASGDFDLSVGSVAAMSGVASAIVTNATHSVLAGIAAGMAAGAAVGLFNGFIIACIGINALIATLGTMQIARGLAYIISHGVAIGVTDPNFFLIGITQTHLFGQLYVPVPVWIMIGTFFLFSILLNRTTFGRNTLAIGGNAEAARLAGVSVTRTKIIIFTLQGLVAGFAGVIEASRFTSGQPTNDLGLELDVISACVLGGVSLTGGVGTMLGVVVGVFIMGAVTNAMNLLNIDTFYQYVVRGGILITAVMVDKLKHWVSV
jgi:L-arabinose transport system permease protein